MSGSGLLTGDVLGNLRSNQIVTVIGLKLKILETEAASSRFCQISTNIFPGTAIVQRLSSVALIAHAKLELRKAVHFNQIRGEGCPR